MAVPRMPQWMSSGDGVPVGASVAEMVFVGAMTVVGRSVGSTLAEEMGGRVVTMTSVCVVEPEVTVEFAWSMGV